MEGIDLAVAVVLAVAALRGLVLGLVRQAFSFAGLGAAFVAARSLGGEAAAALHARVGDALPGPALHALALLLVGLAVWIAVRVAGALVRRGVQAVGLGFADRLGGAALGAAEGALLVALLFGVAGALAGDHPALLESRAYAAFCDAREALRARDGRDVAAPPPLGAPPGATTPARGS